MTRPQIWFVSSRTDGYMAGVVLAATAAEARAAAHEDLRRSRPDVDPETGLPEWRSYHPTPDDIVAVPLGDRYFGSDGEGRLEVDLPTDPHDRPLGTCTEDEHYGKGAR